MLKNEVKNPPLGSPRVGPGLGTRPGVYARVQLVGPGPRGCVLGEVLSVLSVPRSTSETRPRRPGPPPPTRGKLCCLSLAFPSLPSRGSLVDGPASRLSRHHARFATDRHRLYTTNLVAVSPKCPSVLAFFDCYNLPARWAGQRTASPRVILYHTPSVESMCKRRATRLSMEIPPLDI